MQNEIKFFVWWLNDDTQLLERERERVRENTNEIAFKFFDCLKEWEFGFLLICPRFA